MILTVIDSLIELTLNCEILPTINIHLVVLAEIILLTTGGHCILSKYKPYLFRYIKTALLKMFFGTIIENLLFNET